MVQALASYVVTMSALGQPAAGPPKASFELLPSVQAVVPGGEFQLALRFKLQPEWHLYWANPGDAGLPPSVKWTAPEGFEIGPPVFPVPIRHVAPGPISTNILTGRPIITVKVKAPAEPAAGGTVTFEADAAWLVCKENCLRETQKAKISLPVIDGVPNPAHADVFAEAAATQPTDHSEHLQIVPSLSAEQLKAGDSFEVILQLVMATGHSVAAQRDTPTGIKPLDVFCAPTEFVTFGAPIYPEPKPRSLPDKSTTQEFAGRAFIRIPAQLDPGASGAPSRFEGLIVFQSFDESAGRYLPPEAVRWSLLLK